MQRFAPGPTRPRRTALGGLVLIFAALAWLGAAAVGAVMALVFAATLVVIGLMASALIALSAAARGRSHAPGGPPRGWPLVDRLQLGRPAPLA